MSNIVKLTAENVKRIRAVCISPTSPTVVIGGQNGQGKSSVLDAITMALAGKDTVCAEPIRKGQKTAKIILETDELVVTRKFTASGTTLEVTNKEGLKFPSPQAVLDKLCSKISFDPLDFTRAKPLDQLRQLRDLSGLDTSEIDQTRKTLFDQRTGVNRYVKDQSAIVESLPESGPEPVSVADLMKQEEAINNENEQIDEVLAHARTAELGRDALERATNEFALEVARCQKALEAAEIKSVAALKNLHEKNIEVESLKAECAKLQKKDTTAIRQQIAGAENINREALKVSQRKAEQEKLDGYTAQATALTQRIDTLDADREKMIAEAKFPVEGLGFTENGVTYKGFPLDQASSAEQLQVGLAIAIAMNPKMKVMLIRDGSLLDDASLALVAKTAEENGAQVWIERVANDDKCTVVIEDGHIQGVEPPKDVVPQKITTANGLLYRDGVEIGLPEADSVAAENGFQHAEQLVRFLERTASPTKAPALAPTATPAPAPAPAEAAPAIAPAPAAPPAKKELPVPPKPKRSARAARPDEDEELL